MTRELYLTDNHRLTDVSTGQVKIFDHLHCFFVSIEEGELEILLYFKKGVMENGYLEKYKTVLQRYSMLGIKQDCTGAHE